MPFRKFLLFLLITVPFTGLGQGLPLSVSVFNESTAIPFTRFVTTPVHPGIQVGTEFNYRVREHGRLFQTVNLSYFYHRHLNQGIGLNSEFGYEYKIIPQLSLSVLVGLGYMHTFATATEYTFVDGQYEKKADRGNARLFPSVSFDAGYYLKKDSPLHPRLFIRYQSWIEYPYSPDFIPLMTHINLHLGATFTIPFKTGKS